NHGIPSPPKRGMIMFRLIVPKLSLNIVANMMIETKPGTAHGKIKIVLINLLNFTRLSFANIAKNKPKQICNVVATNVHTTVHEKTDTNVFFHSGILIKSLKFSRPTQFKRFLGGELYKS